MTTISIVEDNKEYQEALFSVIKSSHDFVVVNVFENAEDAKALLNEPTDIVIIDIQLPGICGIELIRFLSGKNARSKFLVCSINDDDESIFKALKSGACGYILKDSNSSQIISALQEVLQGGAPMSPYIARRVIKSFHAKPVPKDETLSERENEVLKLLAKGLQYKEIAATLSISHETVKKHLKNIYEKLQVQNKVEAVNKFFKL